MVKKTYIAKHCKQKRNLSLLWVLQLISVSPRYAVEKLSSKSVNDCFYEIGIVILYLDALLKVRTVMI